MMNYRLKVIFSSTLLCLSSLTIFPHQTAALPSTDDYYEAATRSFDYDCVSLDDEDSYEDINEFFDTVGMDHMSRAINPVQVMMLLNLFGIPPILELPFFLHTNFLNKRPLVDQPIFEPDRAEFPGKWVVGTHLFAHKIMRSNFTKTSDKLNSYLAISEALLIERIEAAIESINTINPIPPIDIAKIFSLFENMTVEERQVGFMLHCMKRWRYTTLRVMAPLFYQESNFSLTPDEQDAVAEELGALDPEEEKAFRKAHFISDKIGLGDTRIEVDHRLLKRPSITLRCGALATVPTAWTWGSGFMGSSFAKPSTLPTFELDPIFNAIENPSMETEQEVKTFITDFLLDSFDRMAADLIDVPLGNRRHLGLGLYLREKTPLRALWDNSFAQKTNLTSRISLEWFLPATERRFYIDKINETAFAERDFKSDDPVVAAENLQFLQEQFVSRIFLRAIDTRIVPGVIFRWSAEAQYKGKPCGFNLGLDFWLQNKAHFSSIQTLVQTAHVIDIPRAKTPVARQLKVFGGLVFDHKTDTNAWFFSLNADAGVNTKGLCQDFTLSFNFEASF